METERQTNPIVELLIQIKLAVAQLRLYPPNSPQVIKVATSAFQSVNAFLNDVGQLQISGTPRGLLVNGRRLPALGEASNAIELSTLQLLKEVQVKTVTFKKGLAMDELVSFLHALVKKFWDVTEGKEINARLREARIFQINVDEVEYVAIGSGDMVIEDAARKLEGANARVTDIMRTLDQVIDAAVAEGIGEQLRLQIMKKLLESDPTLIQKAQASGLPGSGTGDAPGWITFEQARQSIGDLMRLLQKAPEEMRDPLRRMGHTLIGGFRHDPIILALMKKFLSEEAGDLLPAWMQEGAAAEAGEAPAVKRTNAILSLQEEEQLPALVAEGPGLVKELAALPRPDLAEELVTALTGFARHTIAGRRAAATDVLLSLLPVLDAAKLAACIAQVEQRLRSALNLERDSTVYPKQADLAAAIVDEHLMKGNLGKAVDLLALLKKHYQVKESSFPQRVEFAFRALEKVASGKGFPAVLEKLRAKDPEAASVLECLDAAAARFLISEMRRCENLVERLELSQVLLRAGAGAGTLLVEETQKSGTPVEALRLAEVIPHAVPSNVAEVALAGLLRHSAPPVRRRAASLLAERAYARAGTFLLDVLRDEPEPQVQVSIMELLGHLKHAPALPVFCDMAESRQHPEEIRAAACTAVGRMGNPAAVPRLIKVCTSGRGLSRILSSTPPSVRAAAARALTGFPSSDEARQTLKQLLNDGDGNVRTAAREAFYAPLAHAFGDIFNEVKLISSVQDAGQDAKKLAGALSEIPLEQICQLLASSQKTGLLLLSFGSAIARVFLHKGRVAAAEFEGAADQEAFNRFCLLGGGYFLFKPGDAPPRASISEDVGKMLLEAFRLRDEGQKRRPVAAG